MTFTTEFPSADTYRLFLQFKHEGRVHTAAFTREVGDEHRLGLAFESPAQALDRLELLDVNPADAPGSYAGRMLLFSLKKLSGS